jgi:acetylornithine/N-succinyldiaminopimelate aminotransferase
VLTFAKSGRYFAMADSRGPVPTDITVIGKSLGMGALSTSMVIARTALSVRSSGTVATSDLRPLTCAVINDGLTEIIASGLIERSAKLGEQLSVLLRDQLVDAFPEVYSDTRGVGVMHGVELTADAAARLERLRTHLIRSGTYVEFMAGAGKRSHGLRYVHPTMRIAPSLVTTPDQAQTMVARLAEGTRRYLASR